MSTTTSAALAAVHALFAYKTVTAVLKDKRYFRSDQYLQAAFNVGEAMVNAYSAVLFLAFPSFAGRELAPWFKQEHQQKKKQQQQQLKRKAGEDDEGADEDVFAHPAFKIVLRLFGATEILVAGLFATVLDRTNATTFLLCVLAGDLAHYVAYVRYTLQHPKLALSVLAHYLVMTTVLYTKLAYFLALNL